MAENDAPRGGPFDEPQEVGPPPALEPFPQRSPDARRTEAEANLPGWLEMLNNRLLLSVLGLVVVLLLAAIVLVAIGHDADNVGVGASANRDDDPSTTSTPVRPRGGLVGETTATITFRNGPNSSSAILGTIPRGAVVAVVGRNEDESWLQVRYPPNSELRGWVDAQFLDVEGDVSRLTIAGPGPQPAAIATATFPAFIEEPFTPATEAPTQTPRPTRATNTPRPTRTLFPTPEPVTPTPPEQPTAELQSQQE